METQWAGRVVEVVGSIFVCLLLDVHAQSEIWYFLHLVYWLTLPEMERERDGGRAGRQRSDRPRDGRQGLVPAMWVHTFGSSDRFRAENQWSLTSCSWEFRPTAAAAPGGRTDVRSLTEIVSLATGDSGSGAGEDAAAAAAAGKQRQRMMSRSQWHHQLRRCTRSVFTGSGFGPCHKKRSNN